MDKIVNLLKTKLLGCCQSEFLAKFQNQNWTFVFFIQCVSKQCINTIMIKILNYEAFPMSLADITISVYTCKLHRIFTKHFVKKTCAFYRNYYIEMKSVTFLEHEKQ